MGVKDLRTGTNCNLLYLANKSWGAISTLKSCEKRRVGGGQQMQIHCQHFPFQPSAALSQTSWIKPVCGRLMSPHRSLTRVSMVP